MNALKQKRYRERKKLREQLKKGAKMKAFSIHDTKAEGFNTPFFQQTFGLAERAFKEAANDPQSQICKNKSDFKLYYVGEFNQQTGVIEPVTPPQHICDAE